MADALELTRTKAALAVGFERGWSVGVQLAVWRDSAPLVTYADGLARDGVAMRDDSLMPWFSGTKLVTAVAVNQLVERGALQLEQTVASVIPEFARQGKDSITVRHVLTHTAGFRRAAGVDALFSGGIEPSALLERIYDAPLEWEPGSRAGYHPTTGFHVLGEVVRRVDGRAFDDYVSEEIFERLGMADSWLALTPDQVRHYGDRVVTMFDTSGDAPRVLERFLRDDGFAWVLPSSSGVGPIHELVRVAEMLRRGGELDGERILRPETVAAMTARHRTGMRDETFGAVIDWGLGVMVNSIQYSGKPAPYGYGDHASPEAFGHGGMQSSVTFADPGRRLSVSIAFNGMPGEPANHRRTQPVVTALYEDLSNTL